MKYPKPSAIQNLTALYRWFWPIKRNRSRTRSCVLVPLILFHTFLFSSEFAEAANGTPPCVTDASSFDPPAILRKAIVVASEGRRVRLYRNHPSECSASTDSTCEGKAYLVPGDLVEVAGVCGGYARVKYVGKSRVFTGWVESTALKAPLEITADACDLKSAALSASDLPARLEGYYSTSGRYCSERDDGVLKPCDPPVLDCMVIKRVDDKHARFHVYSTQVNGSVCEAEGVAEVSGVGLVYRDRDQSSLALGKGFYIDVVNGKIIFRYFSEPDPVTHLPLFCGAQARLDLIAFTLKERKAFGQHSCPDLDN